MSSFPVLSRGAIALVWKEKPVKSGSVRPIIVVEEKNLRDFFAFTTTYLSTYAPFTAFFRVLTPQTLVDMFGEANETFGRVEIPEACVAVTIAECFLQSRGHSTLENLTVQGCLATLSSAMIAALKSERKAEELEGIAHAWQNIRRLLQEESHQIGATSILEFWSFVQAARQPFIELRSRDANSRTVVDFLRATFIYRAISLENWYDLTADLPDLRSALSNFSGTREERVIAFDHAARVLSAADHVDRKIREVVAGALLSELADGNLEYMGLSLPLRPYLPLLPLWFALFSSLKSDTNALTVSNCLGRRVARDLFRQSDLFSVPTADIALHELELRLDERPLVSSLRSEYQSILSVELMPGVVSPFRFSRGRSESEASASPNRERLREARQLLKQTQRILEEADSEQRELGLSESRAQYRYRPEKQSR